MNIPSATYRLQFSREFPFVKAQAIVGYLQKLGISHIYASPIFKARAGSLHGYDVTDPRAINPELGGSDGFDALIKACAAAGIGWIQDIVPNHMALSAENPFLFDVLENGPLSRYYAFFDIDWNHPYEALKGKVLIPVLGNTFGKCLETGELQLKFDNFGLYVAYFDHRLPLRMESYASVFGRSAAALRDELGDANPDLLKFLGVLYTIKSLPGINDIKERYEQIGFVKTLFWEMYSGNQIIHAQCDRVLAECNGKNADTDRWASLEAVLAEQFFRLTYWKTATQELNYRRFFTVNDLIGMRVEDEAVFTATHELIINLFSSGRFQGLRIDHIDGLYDPAAYCERLRKLMPAAYLVVEKILGDSEDLCQNWPVQGTTGYDFLNMVNRLFCSAGGRKSIDRTYATITEDDRPFHELVADKKRLIIGRHMAGDIDNLALRLKSVAGRDRKGIDITMYGLRRALVEVLTFFPVYRSYVTESGMNPTDRLVLTTALDAARAAKVEFSSEFDYIEAFLGLDGIGQTDQTFIDRRRFIMRLQQFTGPLLAKGIEDTVLYSYNRLVSLNEVGGHPDLFGIGVKEFHEYCQHRAAHWPNTMNATATHDTKRGEGTRARINVLSEIAGDWSQQIRHWHALNKEAHTLNEENESMPVMNDEYLLYQTLVGSLPFEPCDMAAFRTRIEEYMIKAVREAKTHSSWIRPNEVYEKALLDFVRTILGSEPGNPFLREFVPFQKMVAWYGMLNSLAQTTLKITAPGIPDFYQGSELWDFSLVDPDNRRSVDFEYRIKMIDEIVEREADQPFIQDLLATPQDGRIKMFLTLRLLALRRRRQSLFTSGRYLPLSVSGVCNDSIVAFMRTSTEAAAIVVVPRMLTRIIKDGQMPLGRGVWGDTAIRLPMEFAGRRLKNVLTGEQTIPEGTNVLVGELLKSFPAALCEI
jgi:(1->4)-alpha-D-glucan 1-alpha-D-glucosylmutase